MVDSLGVSSHKTWILNRCERLDRLLKSIKPPPHNHLAFLGHIREIVRKDADDEAMSELDRLEATLKQAPDGHGSVILNAERYEKYLL